MRDYASVHLVVPPGGSFRESRRIELGPGVITIGRGPSCEVRIDLPGVDDEHAKISEEALIAVGPDCAIGDVPLDAGQRRLVIPGDEIQIGSVVLGLDGQDPGMARGQSRQSPRIRVVEGKNFGDELILKMENHEYILGRSPKADLTLEDREVSREHLKIVRRGYSVFIYDQASTRGSWLGRAAVYQGTRVEWERPRMLKVGATVLSLDLPDDARRAAQVSAPMAPPPRMRSERPPAPLPLEAGPPPANIVAYHYEAKAPPPERLHPSSPPQHPSNRPGAPDALHPPPLPFAPAPPHPPGSQSGSRTAWKKTSPTIGKASGLLLLALAGIAILGVLFVVFSLME